MNQPVVLEVKIQNRWRKAIQVNRVCYGGKGVPVNNREYTLFRGSPVGTIDEVIEFVQGRNIEVDGVLRIDPVEKEALFTFIKGGTLNVTANLVTK